MAGVQSTKRVLLQCICSIALLALSVPALAQGRPARIPTNLTTGPEVGERIPDISAVDQNGRQRNFDNIVGPNGAMILFFRSADW